MESLPVIFSHSDHFQPTEVLADSSHQWLEFVSYLSRFSDADIPDTLHQLNALMQNDQDPVERAILQAGIGRCRVREGHLIDGAQTLGYAFDQVADTQPEAQAFIMIEMASFLGNVDQPDLALLFLEQAAARTQSDYLQHVIRYYQLVLRSRIRDLDVRSELLESALYFQKAEEYSTLAYHYKNLGNIHRKYSDFAAARIAYETAIELADQHQFPHIVAAVRHDLGMWRFHQGDFETAVTELEYVAESCESHYTRSFTLANMGFLFIQQRKWHRAAQYLQQALNIAHDHQVFHLLPGTAYYLGSCYHRQNQLDLARYFLEKGYHAAQELLQHGFRYSGDRKKAVEGYIQFLKETAGPTVSTSLDWSFTLDKTWKEIRSIFQSALFQYVNKRSRSNKDAIATLEIAAKSFYVIRDRTAPLKNQDPPAAVTQFIAQSKILKWQDINRAYEQEVLSFLFQEYERDRRQMADRLDISYTYVQQLTASLPKTMINQHQRNN